MKRAHARATGQSTYFTGKLCNRGHDSYRYTSTGVCIKCSAENSEKYRKDIIAKAKTVSVAVRLKVHPDDVEMLNAFALMLGLQR